MELAAKRPIIGSLGKLSDTEAEVGLGQFAAICGMSEREFANHLIQKIEEGRLLDLLTIDAQVDLGDWILGRFFSLKKFVVMIQLSLNRKRDVCLWCVCSAKDSEDGLIEVHHSIPGLTDNVPREARGLESFEIRFCDMKTSRGD